jgi:hypothetical protein
MRKYTLEPVGLESDSKAPTLYRLYVAGEAAVIHEQAVAIRLFQDQHPGRLHGVQPNRTEGRG